MTTDPKLGCDWCTGKFSDGLMPPGWIYATDIDMEANTFDDFVTRADGEVTKATRCLGCNPKTEVRIYAAPR